MHPDKLHSWWVAMQTCTWCGVRLTRFAIISLWSASGNWFSLNFSSRQYNCWGVKIVLRAAFFISPLSQGLELDRENPCLDVSSLLRKYQPCSAVFRLRIHPCAVEWNLLYLNIEGATRVNCSWQFTLKKNYCFMPTCIDKMSYHSHSSGINTQLSLVDSAVHPNQSTLTSIVNPFPHQGI